MVHLFSSHSYDFDKLKRPIQDRITTLGTGVDGTVRRIATCYEVRGMVSGVTSYDNATVGSGNVVNDVQQVYNSFAQLATEYQSHSGAVNTSTTPSVQYGYADGSTNTTRLTTMTYPNGRVLNYDYGTSGGMNDVLSRIGSLIDNDGTTHLKDYSYLGLANIVLGNSPEPNIQSNLVGFGGGVDPVTGDIYQGLDSFGRVKDLIWNVIGTTTTLEETKHGYDLVGNRIYRAEPVDASDHHDEYYVNDKLYRLNDLLRGSLNSTNTGINNLQFAQCWTLDETGNWSTFQQNSGGSGYDQAQNRVSNPVNEITLIDNTAGATWVTPVYDAAGNMTTMPQPGAPGQSYSATYDAWNRLMQMATGAIAIGQYQYDGMNRRTVKLNYRGTNTTSRDYYYSSSWQILEERMLATSSSSSSLSSSGSPTSPQTDRQFVWGLRYIDDVVLRDRDPSGSGSLSERFYGMQDPNWNVTALCSTAGSIVEQYDYAGYGDPTILDPSFNYRGVSFYTWETQFAGYRWDAENGLYQVRNRYYHASLACFISRPSEEWEINLYRYVDSRPTVMTDPTGDPIPLLILVALGVGAAGAAIGGYIGYTTSGGSGAATIAGATTGFVIGYVTVISFGSDTASLTAVLGGAGGGTLTTGATVAFTMTAAEAQGLAVGTAICIAASTIAASDMCDFYKAWCYWGVVNGSPRFWPSSFAQCSRCYADCIRNGAWPFRVCGIGGRRGPRWPGPNDPWQPVWP